MTAASPTDRVRRRGAAFAVMPNVLLVVLLCAAAPAGGSGVGCEGQWAQSPICLERRSALEARATVEALLESLPDAGHLADTEAPPWSPQEFQAAKTDYEEGMALYRDEYFGDAAAKFNRATNRLLAMEQAWRETLALRLAEAHASYDAGEFGAAIDQYSAVLESASDSEEARAGLSAAQQGATAHNALSLAHRSLQQGDPDTAENHLKSIPAGLLTDDVVKLRQRIAETRRRNRLQQAMSRGFEQLDLGEWADAEAAFTEALRIDPASTAAKDALQGLRRQRADAELAASRARLAARVAMQDWLEAQNLLEVIRQLDPHDSAVVDELARIARLVEVEGHIDNYLNNPQRLSAKDIRNRVRTLIDATTDPATFGSRIIEKRNRLNQAFVVWTTPVEITLHSDNRTEVRIRPGRVLGQFKEHRLAVFPGEYVLSGRRVGYREISLPITVAPGADPQTLEVSCNERF